MYETNICPDVSGADQTPTKEHIEMLRRIRDQKIAEEEARGEELLAYELARGTAAEVQMVPVEQPRPRWTHFAR